MKKLKFQFRLDEVKEQILYEKGKERQAKLDEYFVDCAKTYIDKGAKVNVADDYGMYILPWALPVTKKSPTLFLRNDSTSLFCNERSS